MAATPWDTFEDSPSFNSLEAPVVSSQTAPERPMPTSAAMMASQGLQSGGDWNVFEDSPASQKPGFMSRLKEAVVGAPDEEPVDTADVARQQEQYERDNPFFTRIGQRLKKGVKSALVAEHASNAAASAEAIINLNAPETANPIARKQVEALSPQERADKIAKNTDALVASISNLSRYQKEIRDIPGAPVVSAGEGKSLKEAARAASVSPVGYIADVGVTSAPASAQMLGEAVVGGRLAGSRGAAAGAFAGSANVDYGSELVSALDRAGVDSTDPAAVKAAFTDPVFLDKAKREAGLHAGVVGFFDALSFGVASKVLAPAAKPIVRHAINIPAQAVAQGALGAAGEGGGQLAARNTIDDPSNLLGEFAGEFVGSPMEVASASAAGVRDRIRSRGQPATETTPSTPATSSGWEPISDIPVDLSSTSAPTQEPAQPADIPPHQPAPAADVQTSESAPVAYVDPRLKRENFRNAVSKTVTDDLVEGGGISLVPDEKFVPGESTKPGEVPLVRTPSVHAPWAQEMLAQTGLSVAEVRRAAEKAVAGEQLGVRQAEAVQHVLNYITGERNDPRNIAAVREQIDQARELRRYLQGEMATPEELDQQAAGAPPYGEQFHENEYPPELDALQRVIFESAEEGRARGGNSDVIGRLLERQAPDAEILRDLVVYSEGLKREKPSAAAVERGTPSAPATLQPESPAAAATAAAQPELALNSPAPGPVTRAAATARAPTQADLLGNHSPIEQAVSDLKADRERAIAESPPMEAGPGDLFNDGSRQADIEDVTRAAPVVQPEPTQSTAAIDTAAHEAATSPQNALPEPTKAQKEAGNYQKGHLNINGLDISIENPKGSRRKPEWPPLTHHYGYIRGTIGKDKDHIDVFVGPDAQSPRTPVFVVDQINPKSGAFDEHKVMLGFPAEGAARRGYLDNYQPGWKGLGAIKQFSLEEFKQWLASGETQKPVALTEEPNAEAIRSNQEQAHPAGVERAGGEDQRGENVQQQAQAQPEAGNAQGETDVLKAHGLTVTKTTTNKGNAVWEVSGDTRAQKELLKSLGGRWYGPKKVWSFYKGDPSTSIAEKLPKPSVAQAEKPAPKEQTASTAAEPTAPAQVNLAIAINKYFVGGNKLSWQQLFTLADEAYGGTQAEGKYAVKDAYDAMELGFNMYLRNNAKFYDPSKPTTAKNALVMLRNMRDLADLMPTQSKRTEEQLALQQFSTPHTHAWVAAWVGDVRHKDVVLEPSAGTGDLAVHAANAGAEVHVNEIAPRRAEALKALFGDDAVTAENAAHINALLPDLHPTVVLMNPPFSADMNRVGKMDTSVGASHVEAALKTLRENGRLVAILGKGMALDRPSFRQWWDKIKGKYNVRANIGVSGEEYTKFGTSFDNVIVVIDNNGKTTEEPVIGNVDNVEDLLPMLEGIRNDRDVPREQPSAKPAGEAGATESRREAGSGVPVRAATDEVSHAVESGRATAGQSRGHGERAGNTVESRTSESAKAPIGDRGRGVGAATGERTENARPAGPGESPAAKPSDEARSDRAVGAEFQSADPAEHVDLTTSVYETYRPSVSFKGSQEHPTRLAESAAMASLKPPTLSYKPDIPSTLIESGKLSNVQLEGIAYAGQAHEFTLPNGFRRGFFIGDGTGVGKGAQNAGIILDNWRRGRRKAVWVSENQKLMNDAARDLNWVGMDADKVLHAHADMKGNIKHKDGVVFTTYDTLRSQSKEIRDAAGNIVKPPDRRIDQLVNWLGPDFDGVVIYDESHNLGNSLDQKGNRGLKKAAGKALAGVELQQRLPNARVVYASATGATEVENLAYGERLGLWGEGTAFSSKEDFIDQIKSGGVAAMEVVAKDLKAMGAYVARSLAYQGPKAEDNVSYETLEHKLSAEQEKVFNTLASSWQKVLNNVEAALVATGVVSEEGATLNARAKSAARSAFWGSHQRFFNQVLTSLQMPSVVASIEKNMAAGESAVLQLVNTNEAVQERRLAQAAEFDIELDELDLTPRDILIQYITKSFPTTLYEKYTDEEGNERSRPVQDSKGNPVQNPEAVAQRDALVEELASIPVPDGVLDQLLNHFGSNAVAEITGRKRRLVRDKDTGKMVEEKRSDARSNLEANEFMSGKRRILVFSDAGGTGRSYHADLRAKNQEKRNHYLVQPGWRADKAMQGFGRTHRTNQKQAPHYILVTTNLKAQRRFLSSIARRLDQLGALTKGQRETGGQGLFSAEMNLENEYAVAALKTMVEDVYAGKVPDITLDVLQDQMGLRLVDGNGQLLLDLGLTVPRFLNRLLSLNTDTMDKVFDAFFSRLQANVEHARQQGTLDTGLETISAKTIEKTDDKIVRTGDGNTGETRYVKLKLTNPTKLIQFDELPKDVQFARNSRSEKLYAFSPATHATDVKSGSIIERMRRISQTGGDYVTKADFEQKYRPMKGSSEQMRSGWDKAVSEESPTVSHDLHLITGALLPVWDRLGNSWPRIKRAQTNDGERVLGREISSKDIAGVLKALGVSAKTETRTPAEYVADVLDDGDTLVLANGWHIARRMVSGDNRLEILNARYEDKELLKKQGAFVEVVAYKARYFIPTAEVLKRITDSKPVVEVIGAGAADRFSLRDRGVQSKREVANDKETPAAKSLRQAVEGAIGKTFPEGAFTDLGVPHAFSELANALDKIFGKRVVFFKNNVRDTIGFNGMVVKGDRKTIYLDIQSTRPIAYTAGHELLHLLRKDHPDLYNRVYRVALDEFQTEAVDAFGKQLERNSKAYNLKQPSQDLVHEEMLANFFGDNLVRPEFWARLAGKDPTLFKQFANVVRRFIVSVLNYARGRGYQSDRYFRDLERMRDTAAAAVAEYTKRGASQMVEDSGARFELTDRNLKQLHGMKDGKVKAVAVANADGTWEVYWGDGASLLESKKFRREKFSSQKLATAAYEGAGLNAAAPRRSSVQGETTKPLFDGFDIPSETVFDTVARHVQDKFRRIKTTQREVTKAGGIVDESTDAYLAEELFHGKVEERLRQFEEAHLEPLIDTINERKLSLDDVDQYLYAKHAPERNAHIASINPYFKENSIPGSGMSDVDAADVLAAFEKEGKTAGLEAVAEKVYAVNDARLRLLEQEGLESQQTLRMWREPYQHYVPLRGFQEGGQDEARPRTGRGFDIRGKESKQALGRGSRALSPLTYTLTQMEESIIRAEKNEVGKTFLKLVEANANPQLWEINKTEYKPRYDQNTGEVVYGPDPLHKLADNVLSVKVNGKPVLITIHDDLIARAMKNVGVERTNALVRALAFVNRFLARVNTSLNPEFVLTNFVRDLQTAVINIQGEKGGEGKLKNTDKIGRKILKDLPAALAGSYTGLRGADKAVFGQAQKSKTVSEWTKWFNEYREAGGKIGFFGLNTVDVKRKRLHRMLKLAEGGGIAHVEQGIRALGDFVSDVNGAVENGVRLSAYKNARELGLSTKQAASLARNLTVNFNRKGELGVVANAMYLFYNASVQGSVRMFYALKSPKVRKIALGIVGAAFALAEMNRLIGGDDDDGESYYDKIEPFVKEHNIVIMRPGSGGKYYTIPLPYGYNVLHVLGSGISDIMHNKNPAKVGSRLVIAAMNAFNPFGGDAGLLQTISPTITDPFVQIALNENFYGAPIKPEQRGFGPKKPESQKYWSTVSPVSKWITDTLNSLTGGNTVRPGTVDLSPEVLDYMVSQFLGGAGAFFNRAANYVGLATTQDDEVPLRKIPFVRRFAGEQSEYVVPKRFYENVNEVRLAHDEVQALKKQGKLDDARDAREKNKDLLRLYGMATSIDKSVSEMNSKIRDIRQSNKFTDEEKDRRVKNLREQETLRMKHFNKKYNELTSAP